MRDEHVVGMSEVQMLSFTATAMPDKGPSGEAGLGLESSADIGDDHISGSRWREATREHGTVAETHHQRCTSTAKETRQEVVIREIPTRMD